jgi:thiamine-monophosphate kinase
MRGSFLSRYNPAMPGEFDFIDWIRAQQARSDLVQLPAGDDLAVLKWPADDLLLVGVDQVLDGVHFDSAVHSPRAIGRKVMNRNLSDCAAMACLPAAAVATVALPRLPLAGFANQSTLDYAKELYLGLREAADLFDCAIIGGDTASWDGKLALTVTILGRSEGIQPITRAGAQPGDFIFVTGPLGGSILGRHMTFEPRIKLARLIAKRGPVHAMIDLSDGLSRDLVHICGQSNVSATVNAADVPIHEDAVELSRRDGVPPLDHALHDGEDHELLFASPDEWFDNVAYCIGRLSVGNGIQLKTKDALTPLLPKGWEHKL